MTQYDTSQDGLLAEEGNETRRGEARRDETSVERGERRRGEENKEEELYSSTCWSAVASMARIASRSASVRILCPTSRNVTILTS